MLPGATESIAPEEFNCNNNNPVSSMKHLSSTVSHMIQHSTFCSTNITAISEHPSEVRNCKNISKLSVSKAESGINSNSSSTENIRNTLQNKHLNNGNRNVNYGIGAEIEDVTASTRAVIASHGTSQIPLPKISSNSTPVTNITQNPTTSHSAIQISTFDCSVEPNILNGYLPYMTDPLKNQAKSTHNKSVFVTCSQYSPLISSKYVGEHLKYSTYPIQSNDEHPPLTATGKNSSSNTVIGIHEQRSWPENTYAQHESCNEFSVTTVKNPEYTTSDTLKGPIQNKDENSFIHNLVHSTNLTCNVLDREAEYFPQYIAITTGKIQNQESYALDTTLDQAVTDYNASTIKNQTQK
jgi:hypothetical protein